MSGYAERLRGAATQSGYAVRLCRAATQIDYVRSRHALSLLFAMQPLAYVPPLSTSRARVGSSGAEGRGTPAGSERTDAAATPARVGDTLHMHSVASAAKRHAPQPGYRARKRAAMRASDDA